MKKINIFSQNNRLMEKIIIQHIYSISYSMRLYILKEIKKIRHQSYIFLTGKFVFEERKKKKEGRIREIIEKI